MKRCKLMALHKDIRIHKHLGDYFKRKYERAWHRENSTSNHSRFQAAINHYNFLGSECNHYSNIVAENHGNPEALWNCFKKILHRSSFAVLPDCTNKTDLANTFCKVFSDKILKIRSTLQSSTPSSVTRFCLFIWGFTSLSTLYRSYHDG